MTFDQIVAFNVIIFCKAVAASWRNRHWYDGRARHRVSYLGTKDAVRANDLVWLLRNERHQPIFHRMHDNTETLVLA